MCAFEQELRAQLDRRFLGPPTKVGVPICVQRKSADVGVALTATEWFAFPFAARNRLIALPTSDEFKRRNYATFLEWLLYTFVTQPDRVSKVPKDLPLTRPWYAPLAPQTLAKALQENELDWDLLSTDARFALVSAAASPDGNLANILRSLRDAPAICVSSCAWP